MEDIYVIIYVWDGEFVVWDEVLYSPDSCLFTIQKHNLEQATYHKITRESVEKSIDELMEEAESNYYDNKFEDERIRNL